MPPTRQDQPGIPARFRPLLGRDPADTGGLRAFIRDEAEAEMVATGAVRQTIRRFDRRREIEYDLTEILDTEPPELGAAVLRQQAAQPGTLRTFRVGEIEIKTAAGTLRALGIMEYARVSWWLSYRLLTDAADWKESTGATADDLDEPFQRWLQTGHQGKLSTGIARAVASPGPARGRVKVEAIPAAPTDAREAARFAETMVRADLLAGRFEHVTVIVFRRRTVERWEIPTMPGCSLDDLVRNVAQLAPVKAVALVRNAEGPGPNGEVRKALGVTAECAGVQWADAWHIVPGDGEVEMVLVDEQELGTPGPQSWLDVAPAVKLGIALPWVRGKWMPFGEA